MPRHALRSPNRPWRGGDRLPGAPGRTPLVDEPMAPLPSARDPPQVAGTDRSALTLVSFGFKYDLPPASHSFDVSFLKKPARQEGWSLSSEPGEEMSAWFLEQPKAVEFLDSLLPLALFLSRADDDAHMPAAYRSRSGTTSAS